MSDNEFDKLGKRVGNLDDLPPELRSQLQIAKIDELEEQIITTINELYAGMANIDEILVGLFRKFQLVQKRQYTANKLYRMAQTGLIFSVKGKKGVYSTDKNKENFYSSKE